MLSRQDAKHAKKNSYYIPNLGALCAFAGDIVFPISSSIQNFKYLSLKFLTAAAVMASRTILI
jgi:hypothetical protein